MDATMQPDNDVLERIGDIHLYRRSIADGHFPILEKEDIARDFPDNWMTPQLQKALASGDAELVWSTGTNHARMQLIRPPFFLLHSYYRLWSNHPELSVTWQHGYPRMSLTTVRATEHVLRLNAARGRKEFRWLDDRTYYLNQRLDPAHWTRNDIERMLQDIESSTRYFGGYHMDCSAYHLVHFLNKVKAWNLQDRLRMPSSIVLAYEMTPYNVWRYLKEAFDVPIVDLFGSTELGYLFHGAPGHPYLPHLDDIHVELEPIAGTRDIFSLIVTSLRNPWMPLVRYRSGDCARTKNGLPDSRQIVRFCGREKELLQTETGMHCHADIDDIVAMAPQIFNYQLAVDGPCRRLDYTTFDGAPLAGADSETIAQWASDRLGGRVSLAHCPTIAIGSSGKYAWLAPAVISAPSE